MGLRGRAGHTVALYVPGTYVHFSFILVVKQIIYAATALPVQSRPMNYLLIESGTPPEPKLIAMLSWSWKKADVSPNLI